MKKLLSFILCLAAVASVMAVFSLHGFAEEERVFPEIDLPQCSYKTFAETGFPYDEITALFPENLELEYKDGVLKVKDIGSDEVEFVDYLNYERNSATLEGGYWSIPVSEEAYAEGGEFWMPFGSYSCTVYYDEHGKRGNIAIDLAGDECVILYPEEGYGEQYVEMRYKRFGNIEVSDNYEAGLFDGQRIWAETDNGTVDVSYDEDGNVLDIIVWSDELQEYVWYFIGKGWSSGSYEYEPVPAPAGFENATVEDLMRIAPTDIGCEHEWNEATCDYAKYCKKCKRFSGEPLGHKWVEGEEYDSCSACPGILYTVPSVSSLNFERRPYLNISETGFDFSSVLSEVPKKIDVKYENGKLYAPSLDGCLFFAFLKRDGYLDKTRVDGWDEVKISEDQLKDIDLTYSYENPEGDKNGLMLSIEYDTNGELKRFRIHFEDNDREVRYYPKSDLVELEYDSAEGSGFKYTDSYVGGVLASQAVRNLKADIKVYYDSDLNVEKVRVRFEDAYVFYLVGQGWSLSDDTYTPGPIPEGYANKDMSFYKQTCPTTVDFCIHSFKTVKGGSEKKCVKCGESIVLGKAPLDTGVIVLISAAAVVVIAVAILTAVVIKRKKAQ